jgi:flagellar hook assembly protein FlgD
LIVFDAAGRVVAHLVDRVEVSGDHHVRWSGKDDRGRTLASGVYWYRLTTDFGVRTRRLVLAR